VRTLFLSPRLPYPLDTGMSQRIYHLLKAAAAVSEVTLVCPAPGGESCAELDALRALGVRALPYAAESIAWRKDCRRARGLQLAKAALRYAHPLQPSVVSGSASAEARRLVRGLGSEPFDLVWAERPHMSPLVHEMKAARRVIIDLDDIEHRKMRRLLACDGFHAHNLPVWLDYWKLRRLEHGLARRYEVAVCSTQDRDLMAGGKRVWVIPNGVDVPPPPCDVMPPKPVFVFVGSMDYGPNADAVKFFVREVWPRIEAVLPEAEFLIVGREPTAEVQALARHNILVTGAVSAVAPYLRRAIAMVAPIRVGGGTRIKILEALAHGTPVVSSRVGAEGLEVEPGRHLLLADTPEDMAAAALLLYHDGELRRQLATAGYKLVSEKYDWRRIENLVQEIIMPAPPLNA
jgi:polysaccharide biosynthesis protein PslH